MKARTRNSAAVALMMSVVTVAASRVQAADTYDLDQSHFSIVFSISHLSMSYTYGMFRKAQGRVILDPANPAANHFQLTINADSIDTNHPQRDQHLKSPDFFNVAEFPTITFESTSCVQAATQEGLIVYQVTGNLTIHGITRQVTLPIQLLGQGAGPGGRDFRAGFMSQFELKRSDFGMNNLLEMVGDPVGISVSFEAVKQGGAAPPR